MKVVRVPIPWEITSEIEFVSFIILHAYANPIALLTIRNEATKVS